MSTITLSASTASSVDGAVRFIAKIHNLSTEILPVGWIRTIQQPAFQSPMIADREHPIRRFVVTAHIGNDPRKQVFLQIDVQKIMTIADAETWLPIYGVLSFSDGDQHITAYHCAFNPLTGEMNVYDMRILGDPAYPYAFVSA